MKFQVRILSGYVNYRNGGVKWVDDKIVHLILSNPYKRLH